MKSSAMSSSVTLRSAELIPSKKRLIKALRSADMGGLPSVVEWIWPNLLLAEACGNGLLGASWPEALAAQAPPGVLTCSDAPRGGRRPGRAARGAPYGPDRKGDHQLIPAVGIRAAVGGAVGTRRLHLGEVAGRGQTGDGDCCTRLRDRGARRVVYDDVSGRAGLSARVDDQPVVL